MATVEIIRHKVSGSAASGGAAPVADGNIIGQKILTLGAASVRATDQDASLVAGTNEVWTLVVSGGPARVLFGPPATVTAAAGVGWPLPDGTMKPFSIPPGWTVAIING